MKRTFPYWRVQYQVGLMEIGLFVFFFSVCKNITIFVLLSLWNENEIRCESECKRKKWKRNDSYIETPRRQWRQRISWLMVVDPSDLTNSSSASQCINWIMMSYKCSNRTIQNHCSRSIKNAWSTKTTCLVKYMICVLMAHRLRF